jgi:hypothetical protein
MTVAVNDVSAKWVIWFKIVLTVAGLVLPVCIAFGSWLVVSSFETKSDLQLLTQTVQELKGAGPRFTEIQSDLDNAIQTRELMHEVKNMVDPIIVAVHKLDNTVDQLKAK